MMGMSIVVDMTVRTFVIKMIVKKGLMVIVMGREECFRWKLGW